MSGFMQAPIDHRELIQIEGQKISSRTPCQGTRQGIYNASTHRFRVNLSIRNEGESNGSQAVKKDSAEFSDTKGKRLW